jgi:SAM-dependent methyltransferase
MIPMADNVQFPPPALCGHDQPLKYSKRHKAQCPVCGSFWDLDALNSKAVYDKAYPELRSHFAPLIGQIKVKTLQSWLSRNHLDLKTLRVCETGFGGGHCLKFIQDNSKAAYGIEAVQENIENAARLGVRTERLFDARNLPETLSEKIDLWVFQDSFEHIPDPAAFVAWLNRNSSTAALILLVAPDAGSLSEKLLGNLWPHKLPDHHFHWTRKGIEEFFLSHGFELERSFYPTKVISPVMVAAHLNIKNTMKTVQRALLLLPELRLKFNIGEMGLLFRMVA